MSGKKCPPCECKAGLPMWVATYSDMVTLLLTFFVLLLSFAKTETGKYEAALGSVLNAFGGNTLFPGEVLTPGKSIDNAPTMLDSPESARPFPIEFLTSEGLLDKHEINRESDESLTTMKNDLVENSLQDFTDVYEMPEGVKAHIKESIYFQEGQLKVDNINVEVFEKMINLLTSKDWVVQVLGHAAKGEVYTDSNGKKHDAIDLAGMRAQAVARSLIRRGVAPTKVESVSYGDAKTVNIPGRSVEENRKLSRRVEFIIRKVPLDKPGHKVRSQ